MKLPGTEDYKSALQFAKEVKNILEQQAISLDDEQDFSFYLYVPEEKNMHACAQTLENLGMEVEISTPDSEDARFLCTGNLTMRPTSAALHDIGEVFLKLAQKYNGEFDGWDVDNEILREAFGKFFDELLKEFDEEELDLFTPPSQIHLQTDPRPEWLAQEETLRIINQIKALGFHQSKSYIIKETPRLALHSLFSADSTIYCIVFKAGDAPPWVEFHVTYEDKLDLSVSNIKGVDYVNELPGSRAIFCPHLNIPELYQELNKHLEPKPIFKVHAWNFKNLMEKTYQQTMQWRNQRGGLTFEEFKAHVNSSEFSSSELRDLFLDYKYKELRKWHNECVSNFAELNNLDDLDDLDDFDELLDNVFLVSDKFEPNTYLEYLDDFINVPEELLDPDRDASRDYADSRQLFLAINAALPPDARAIKAGSVSSPLQADIYRVAPHDQLP